MGVAQQLCGYSALQTKTYYPHYLSRRASPSSRNICATPPPWINSKVTTSKRCARRLPHLGVTMDSPATLSTIPQTVAIMVSPYLPKAHWRNNTRVSHCEYPELTLPFRRICCCMLISARPRPASRKSTADVWNRSPPKAMRPTHSCSLSHGRTYGIFHIHVTSAMLTTIGQSGVDG